MNVPHTTVFSYPEGLDVPLEHNSLCNICIYDKSDPDWKILKSLDNLDPCFSRACGSLVGCVVGDALGAPYEFQAVNYEANDCQGFMTGRTASHFRMQPGMWTDDASMGACLADSLITKQRFDPVDCRLRFHHWWNHGYCNAFAKCPSHSVGLGGNISMSIFEFARSRDGIKYTNAGDLETSGNGSLMRNAPAPVFCGKYGSVEDAMKIAFKQSKTTHQGIEAAELCRLQSFIICTAIRSGVELDKKLKEAEKSTELIDGVSLRLHVVRQFLDQTLATFIQKYPCERQSVMYLASSLPEPLKKSRSAAAADAGVQFDPNRNWNWRDKNFRYSPLRVSQSAGYIGSYAMDGLAMALHVAYHYDGLPNAMMKMASLRGDADTTCDILGEIIGAIYGLESFPAEWIRTYQQWEPVEGLFLLRAYKLYERHDDKGKFVEPKEKNKVKKEKEEKEKEKVEEK